MTLPCLCLECEHQMSWHEAFDQCGDAVSARCTVPGCMCILVGNYCEHISGRDSERKAKDDDRIAKELGIVLD